MMEEAEINNELVDQKVRSLPLRKEKKFAVGRILGGDILKEDFMLKQSKLIILIAFLFILFISNRYSCLKKLTEIDRLRTELKDIKYENLVISAELTSDSKQSQIEDLVKAKGLNLSGARSPVYVIRK
ncbi:MAG: hypothetical protein LBR67_05045 [Dysgonamonadaceae bacterium]|jgi:cell division protein FtsL|nr:hypothetical protein [Dysgonamonadaceae bacterium]